MTVAITTTTEHVVALTEASVHRALREGGTIGMSLSGGIDSSTIYALAHKMPPAFTGYYEGEAYDEREYARRIVAGRKHHEVEITPEDFLVYFDEMLLAAKQPYQGPGTFGQWMVAKYAREQGITVLLSGEGGDELFGGYARLMIVAGEPRPDGYEDYKLPDGYPHSLEAALAYDYERLPDLLAVDDQMTAAHCIEARAPFTDTIVTDFVLSLPARMRVGKQILKEGMRGRVPDEILDRTDKRGFPTPFVEWAQGPLRDFVYERIGYIPDPAFPWARKWWTDLCETSRAALG